MLEKPSCKGEVSIVVQRVKLLFAMLASHTGASLSPSLLWFQSSQGLFISLAAWGMFGEGIRNCPSGWASNGFLTGLGKPSSLVARCFGGSAWGQRTGSVVTLVGLVLWNAAVSPWLRNDTSWPVILFKTLTKGSRPERFIAGGEGND